MTRLEIQSFFPAAGVLGNPNFGGLNYAVPTLAWLQGPFWDFFKGRYWATNSDKWKFRWECRDFARAYACAAQEAWGDTPGGDPDVDALAVGEIWFSPSPAIGHAICPVITENGLQFIDPQTGAIYPVTPEQFESRYFLRF
jgi:hypothetical protein